MGDKGILALESYVLYKYHAWLLFPLTLSNSYHLHPIFAIFLQSTEHCKIMDISLDNGKAESIVLYSYVPSQDATNTFIAPFSLGTIIYVVRMLPLHVAYISFHPPLAGSVSANSVSLKPLCGVYRWCIHRRIVLLVWESLVSP